MRCESEWCVCVCVRRWVHRWVASQPAGSEVAAAKKKKDAAPAVAAASTHHTHQSGEGRAAMTSTPEEVGSLHRCSVGTGRVAERAERAGQSCRASVSFLRFSVRSTA